MFLIILWSYLVSLASEVSQQGHTMSVNVSVHVPISWLWELFLFF